MSEIALAPRTACKEATLDALVVDDDAALAEEIADVLRGAGLSAIATEDAGGAMGLLLDRRPRLLIADVNMPLCDGVKLAVLAGAVDSRVAIVLMSADPTAITRAIATTGVLGVVDKPIEPAMLCRVAHALTGRGARRSADSDTADGRADPIGE